MAQLNPVAGDPRSLLDALSAWDLQDDPPPLVVATSGSTGAPKLVRLTRAALRASVAATHAYLGGYGQWLLALPVGHVAGLQVLFRTVRSREPFAVLDDAGPQGWRRAVEAMTGTRRYTSVVPTQLVRLLESSDTAGIAALARLDAVLVGGGGLRPEHRRAAEERGVRVVSTYGLSETGGGCVYDGHPLDGVALKISGQGEVLLRGPSLFEGYDDGHGGLDVAATEQVMRDGWLHTADLGRLDADGRLELLGRRDQVVVSGGVNVPGGAVERQLLADPRVREAAVVGVPDAEWGELVTAVVVADGGVAPRLEDLRELVRPRLWAPRALLVLEQLPRTDNDKVDRAALAELVARRADGP